MNAIRALFSSRKSGLSALDMAAVCHYLEKGDQMDREQVVALQHQRFATKNTIPIAVFLKRIGKRWLKWGG